MSVSLGQLAQELAFCVANMVLPIIGENQLKNDIFIDTPAGAKVKQLVGEKGVQGRGNY